MELVDKLNRFIKRSVQIHGDVYNYDKSVYTGIRDKLIITCKIHGDFEMTPNNHISNKQGCKKCKLILRGQKATYSKDDVLKQFNEKHNSFYTYDLSGYKNWSSIISVKCPAHGWFKQSVKVHRKGHGCIECGKSNINRKTSEDYFKEASEAHGGVYQYSNLNVMNNLVYFDVVCEKHGKFTVRASNHISKKSGCPDCVGQNSKGENELADYLSKFTRVEKSNRKILFGKELDIFLPEKNIAIEYNGLYWHSDLFRDTNFHLNKLDLCKDNGVFLIHIFEDDWNANKEILKSYLKSKLGIYEEKYHARNCCVGEIDNKTYFSFLNTNHIQGKVNASIKLGLFENNKILSVMSFGKYRKNLGRSHQENHYELLRFCTKIHCQVVGGASKLLKYFETKYKPKRLISYADRCRSSGDIYFKLGFKHTKNSLPNYFYVKGSERFNRFQFRKSKLVDMGYDKNKTEKEIMIELGYNRVYDCGTMLFEKSFEEESLWN